MNAADQLRRDLARQFFLAYVAYNQGVSFRTAEKNYGEIEGEIGPLWFLLADTTITAMEHRGSNLLMHAPEQLQ